MHRRSRVRAVLTGIAARVHAAGGKALLSFKRATGLLRPLRVQPYVGHGTSTEVHLKGRVREESGVTPAAATDTAWDNVRNMARRFAAAPIPGADVRIRVGAAHVVATTDEEGYFRAALRPDTSLPPGWNDVEVELLAARDRPVDRATSRVLVPHEDAAFGVISDLDDTVMRTGLTDMWLAAQLVLLNNAHTRTPFHGVAGFYTALQRGADGQGKNPLFYVSSSPWNLYNLVIDFLRHHDVPAGPLFLRAWGLDADSLPGGGHAAHKSVQVQHLLDTYPGLPFVLIGDSGQEDPEMYRDVALASPDRVRAIYIRDVTNPIRDEQVHAIAREVRAAGVEFLLVEDTVTAARHAAEHGLIEPGDIGIVKAQVRAES